MQENNQTPWPSVHPRSASITGARDELFEFVVTWSDRHTITTSELLMMLADELSRNISLAVRSEREILDGSVVT